MPQGLEIWNANGDLVLDINSRIGLIISHIQTGTVDGSVTDARLGVGTPFWFCVLNSFTVGYVPVTPTISLSGNTLSWQFPGYTYGVRSACTISYGVY